MDELTQLKNNLEKISARNAKVEADKAWETSITRKIIIALLTCLIVVIFFTVVNLSKPWLNALVPTAGFLLSTLSLSVFKKIWLKYYKK